MLAQSGRIFCAGIEKHVLLRRYSAAFFVHSHSNLLLSPVTEQQRFLCGHKASRVFVLAHNSSAFCAVTEQHYFFLLGECRTAGNTHTECTV